MRKTSFKSTMTTVDNGSINMTLIHESPIISPVDKHCLCHTHVRFKDDACIGWAGPARAWGHPKCKSEERGRIPSAPNTVLWDDRADLLGCSEDQRSGNLVCTRSPGESFLCLVQDRWALRRPAHSRTRTPVRGPRVFFQGPHPVV